MSSESPVSLYFLRFGRMLFFPFSMVVSDLFVLRFATDPELGSSTVLGFSFMFIVLFFCCGFGLYLFMFHSDQIHFYIFVVLSVIFKLRCPVLR